MGRHIYEMYQPHRKVIIPPGHDSLQTVASLLAKYQSGDYFAYEREGVWHIGLSNHASLRVDPQGKTATIDDSGNQDVFSITGPLSELARKFTSEHLQPDGKMFGQAGFNYGAHVRGQTYSPGRWPILSLMIPITEVTLEPDQINLKSRDEKHLSEVCDYIDKAVTYNIRHPEPVNTQCHEKKYMNQVAQAVKEIKARQYTKVIMSRAIDLEKRVDIPATLLNGRRSNTPARTFALNHGGYQATGFSLELVVSV
ncbi:hypothetical protein EG329_005412 [Mollisiaceae sp. DMI_Dod_QoI]|nr:hypothetical protein EG329_005412 [Helotiales sp. DMI_Dod_QoI]